MLQIVKTYPDGSQRLQYNGVQFSTNQQGKILYCENWDIVEQMETEGLARHEFYPHLYGHTDHFLTATPAQPQAPAPEYPVVETPNGLQYTFHCNERRPGQLTMF